jgi:hypothetical protein
MYLYNTMAENKILTHPPLEITFMFWVKFDELIIYFYRQKLPKFCDKP